MVSDLPPELAAGDDAGNARAYFVAAVALGLTPGIGVKTISRLLEKFGSLEAILQADGKALRQVEGVGPKIAAGVRRNDATYCATLDRDLRQWASARDAIRATTWLSVDYPPVWADLDDGPLVAFYRGAWLESDWQTVAIVGTREASPRALQRASQIAADFAAEAWTVASGLARGIDTAAHRGALDAGGRSLAVLGGGIAADAIYPSENRTLAERIAARGALFCEGYPLAQPSAQGLTIRNRLISGLSRAVIVVEGSASSGAMHAARYARKQGRLLFTFADGGSGCVQLLADGALAFESAAKVIAAIRADGLTNQ